MFVSYKNGNYRVYLSLKDGTKIRINNENDFSPTRPESIDVKITNQCRHNCRFCHENSNINGKVASLESMTHFVQSLPPYIEIAVGGGNLMDSFIHTEIFLKMLKEVKAIPSITVHQKDFMEYLDIIDEWKHKNLIYGVGVSLSDPADINFITAVQTRPYVVIHVIAGIFHNAQYAALMDKNLKILILGYKCIRRGEEYAATCEKRIKYNIAWLETQYKFFKEDFNTVAFDNLALEQLHILNKISPKDKELYFMGEDGTTTFYVDLVEDQFAKSSTSLSRSDILDLSVQEMYYIIRGLEFLQAGGEYIND